MDDSKVVKNVLRKLKHNFSFEVRTWLFPVGSFDPPDLKKLIL